jgi:hypothetical protein
MRKRRIHPKKHHSRASRDLEFFLNVTSAEPHKVTQEELSDFFRDLELSNNNAELLSSGRHCESDSISLPPKRF